MRGNITLSMFLILSVLAASIFTLCPTNTEPLPLGPSVGGSCGKDIVNCANNNCCSLFGFCGDGPEFCNNDQGCQENFGRCEGLEPEHPVSKDQTCGPSKNTNCPAPGCCSKFGNCGFTDEFCLVSQGCLDDFGVCNSTLTGNRIC